MRITSKKMLAIVLSVAMLASCMVFSFSANAAVEIKWKNDFDNAGAVSGDWSQTAYSTSGGGDNVVKSGRSALYTAGAGINGGGAMMLSADGTTGSDYSFGFRLFADHSTEGNYGGESSGDMTAARYTQGRFKAQAGVNFIVEFSYKLISTSATVKLYASISDTNWTKDNAVQSYSVEAATLTADDARQGEWVTVAVLFPKEVVNSRGMHIYAKSVSGLVDADIAIDSVKVKSYSSSEVSHQVSFVYNGDVVGTSAGYNTVPVVDPKLDIEAPAGYKMEFYSDAALETKLDVVRYGAENTVVYVKMVKDANVSALFTEDYERFIDKSFGNLDDSGNTYNNMYKFGSSAANGLTGNGSGRILSNKFAGTHGITQGFINAFADNLALTAIHSSTAANLAPKAGYNYSVTFEAYADENASIEVSLFDKEMGAFPYSSTHMHQKQVVALTAGEWKTVTLTLDNAAACSTLMLGVGVTGKENEKRDETGYPPVIYIDNVAVTEYGSLTTAADAFVQDFEGIPNYTSLKNTNHGGAGNAALTSSAKRSGNQSVWLQTANNTGAGRIQFNIPGIDSEFFTAEKGTTYKVTFYVMPKDTNPKTQMNFWLAAADKDYKFADGTDKSNYALYEASNVELVAGAWSKISFTTTDPVNDVYAGGVMRLGICGPEEKTYDFWVDDIKVEECIETSAWGFESEALGTDVDSKKSKGYTSVSDNYAHSGSQSLYVYNGTNLGRERNMIYLKNASGSNVTVVAGKKYLVSFYAMATEESPKSVYLNMWFATGNGTAVRPASGDGDINFFFDDVGTSVVGLTKAENKGKWVKVTRYFEVTGSTDKGDNLLMGISDPTADNVGGHWYMDDLSVVCLDDIAITEKDRTAYLYRGEAKNGYTNLHKNTTDAEDDGIYTSIRLGAKYLSGDANGSTYILDGVEYEIVERGIVAGKDGMTLDATGTKGTDYLWKSSVTSNGGFASNWANVGVDVADAADRNEITYTLRLANMDERWFAETYDEEFEFRSYFVLKAPYYVKNSTSVSDVTFTVYGTTSDAFTFNYLASTFAKDFWFTNLVS